jgi:glycosyltransferase involved in cell wall biosynthesis
MGQMALWRRWRNAFTRVVANSDATRNELEANGFDDVTVIPCGVPRTSRGGARAATPTVLFAGRLTRQKGVHVLLAAWPAVRLAIPDAQLVIAGDGPERAELERAAPDGVTFAGYLTPDALGRYADAAWVQVVPSIGFEPFGLIAAEAMMRELPVVATRAGGLAEVVADGITGMLVPPNDGVGLATALTELLRDPVKCERMGVLGRARAEELFHEELYADRFVALYESMLAGDRPPA